MRDEEAAASDEAAHRLLDCLDDRTTNHDGPFSEQTLEDLNTVANTWLGPAGSLSYWQIAVDVLTTADPDDYDNVRRVVADIAAGLTRTSELLGGTAGPATVPVLTKLLYVAARTGQGDIARDLLRSYRQKTNLIVAAASDVFAYLDGRPETSLVPAANAAFEAVDIELAVLCAEAGRLKLLTALQVPTGRTPTEGDDTQIVEEQAGTSSSHTTVANQPSPEEGESDYYTDDDDFPFDPSLLLPFDLTHDEYNERLHQLRRENRHQDWLKGLLVPWTTASVFTGTPAAETRPGPTKLQAVFMAEPDINAIGDTLQPDQILIYPYFTSAWTGVVFLTSTELRSVILETDVVERVARDHNMTNLHYTAGRIAAAELTDRIKGKVPYVVTWAPHNDTRLRNFTNGINDYQHVFTKADGIDASELDEAGNTYKFIRTLTIPSARLMKPNPMIGAPAHLAYLGDSTNNLAGAWIEAAAWATINTTDTTPNITLGPNCTRSELRKALATTDLLALAVHAEPTDDAGPILILADGPVAYYDIINNSVSLPTQVILASCTAGATAQGAPADDALGLATALLVAGTRRVLAPTEPVDDMISAALIHLLTRALNDVPDLRMAWALVGYHIRAHISDPAATIGQVLGEVPQLPDGYPYPPATITRALARNASALLPTYYRYVLFGT